VARILKNPGVPAGHYPLESSVRRLGINEKTAAGLGLTVPDDLLKFANHRYR
jgi:hypothetical protein